MKSINWFFSILIICFSIIETYSQNLISFKKDSITLKEGELERLIQFAKIIKKQNPKMYLKFYSNIDYSNDISHYYLGFRRFIFIKSILDTIFIPSDSIIIIFNPEVHNGKNNDSGLFVVPGYLSQKRNKLNIKNGELFQKRIFQNKGNSICISDNNTNNLFVLNNILNYLNYTTDIVVVINKNYPKMNTDSLDLYYYKVFYYIYTILTSSNRENVKIDIGYSVNYNDLYDINDKLNYFLLRIVSPNLNDRIKILYKYKIANNKIIIYEKPFNIELNKNINSN